LGLALTGAAVAVLWSLPPRDGPSSSTGLKPRGGPCSRRQQNAQPVALPGVRGPSRPGFPQRVWIPTTG